MTGNVLYDTAMSFLGVPYKWGGNNPVSGLDCSGLVQCILQSVGIDPPGDQTAHALWSHFKSCEETQALGALVFFGNQQRVIHVGFMVDDWRMIEAGGGGQMTRTVSDAGAIGAYVRIRPILYRSDLVGVRMPKYWRL